MSSKAALHLPRLRADQWGIAQHPAKVKVLACGRRWGKSVLGGVLALATSNIGYPVAWVVPEYKNSSSLWRFAKSAVAPLRNVGLVRTNEGDRLIEFKHNGGFMQIFSADNPDSIRGNAFKLVIVDEAARIGEDVYYDTIEPTLADYDGDVLLISTPRGMNWFFVMYDRGLRDGKHIMSWQAPTRDNPNPLIRQAYDRAKEKTPSVKFRQEWDAEFVPDGSGAFSNVDKCATANMHKTALSGHQYVQGLDFGRANDYTVIATMDVKTNEIVDYVRINEIDYTRQRAYITDAYRRFLPTVIVAEENSIGNPIITELKRAGLPVQGFTTTSASKNQLVDAFALALQNEAIRLPFDETLLNEIKAYAGKPLKSGLYQYSAPSGMHDDIVMACMLALWAARRGGEIRVIPYNVFYDDGDWEAWQQQQAENEGVIEETIIRFWGGLGPPPPDFYEKGLHRFKRNNTDGEWKRRGNKSINRD